MQVIAAQKKLRGDEAAQLDTIGSWTQALGAVIAAIGLDVEAAKEKEGSI